MKNTTMKQNEQKINETLNYLAGFDPDEKERYEQEYPMAGYDDEDVEDILDDAIEHIKNEEDDSYEAFDIIIDYFDQKINEIKDKIEDTKTTNNKVTKKQFDEATDILNDPDVRYEAFDMLIDYFEQKIYELQNDFAVVENKIDKLIEVIENK